MATPNSITFKKVNWKHLVLNGVHIGYSQKQIY